MAINPLQIPIANINSDITPQLSQLTASINAGQKRQTLADLGRDLASGNIDYTQAAGRIASLGDIGATYQFLQLAEADKKRKAEQAAGQQFNQSLSSLYGGAPQQASPAGSPMASGPVVPNDDNAIPGTVGMNQRLADLSQDFIQDNPGAYLSSGVRSTADQARLYADRANNPNPVAPPGSSRHERGLAVDIGGMTPDQRSMLPQYGLGQPVANDPPHVELARNTQLASNDPAALPVNAQATQGQDTSLSPRGRWALQMMGNPNLPSGQRAIAKSIYDNEQKNAQQAADPMRSLQMQKLRQDIAKADREPEKGPVLVELYDEQTGQPYKATYDPETKDYKRVGGVKAPSGMTLTTNPDGTISMTQGPVGKGGKLTEGQSKDVVFVTRATGAMPIINKLGDNLASVSQYGASKMGVVGNYLKSASYQKAEQAGKEFLQAILRKDTGAAITKEETQEYGTVYLPQPGDSAGVLAQKKASRQRAVHAIQLGLPPQAILALENGGVNLPPNPQSATRPQGQNTTKSGISWSIE